MIKEQWKWTNWERKNWFALNQTETIYLSIVGSIEKKNEISTAAALRRDDKKRKFAAAALRRDA